MFRAQEIQHLPSGGNHAADVATALRDQFGDDALAVAQKQHDVAEADQQALWREVIECLSR